MLNYIVELHFSYIVSVVFQATFFNTLDVTFGACDDYCNSSNIIHSLMILYTFLLSLLVYYICMCVH